MERRRMCFEFGGLQHQASPPLRIRVSMKNEGSIIATLCMYVHQNRCTQFLNEMVAVIYYDPLRKPCG